MGRLEVRKTIPRVYIDNGKIKSTYPIDWDGTIRLWYEDQESRNKKTLLKKKEKAVFRIVYNKSKAIYTNKNYFEFIVNRTIKRSLKDIILQGDFDAFNSR
jgi:hypothetical protein